MLTHLLEHVHPSWMAVLASEQATLTNLEEFLNQEIESGRSWLPSQPVVLRAFSQPFDSFHVLIMGQDPYPTPGHAVGLSFSVASDVTPLPRSLANIYKELCSDIGCPTPRNGDLQPWADQGVLLLNRVLTVEAGNAGSHRGKGWERVTEVAIRALASRKQPLVAILWGNDAQTIAPFLGDVPVISSAHPSPLSASRGFFGSRPFSRANALLEERGAKPIRWELPS
ncbi:MAG: uracil-DNA glycosylase [Candidatus Nanopelagicales bacterium]|nr:uracil-DNA glycosylase [Candidatus Nanopelagicales bacterium]